MPSEPWEPGCEKPLRLSGIDVAQVTVVVNFSLPVNQEKQLDFETYLHRIGRTGRFGKKGIAFNMVERQTTYLVHSIEEHFREYPCAQLCDAAKS